MSAAGWTIEQDALWPVAERYEGAFPAPPISYGTVRDLTDSADHMPSLAVTGFDLRDLQRCWIVKAMLGNVPRGARIAEIDAGEPFVADMLSRLGYEVTVVDPYDRSGAGPRDFTRYQEAFPSLRFVHERFPPSEALGDIAAVYSISVLQQAPLERIDAVLAASRELVAATGGWSIHAVDHVLAGWGADEHRERLERIVAALGLSAEELGERLAAMKDDPETYLVSPEEHNRRRGDVPYDQYPMRRIGSVNLIRS